MISIFGDFLSLFFPNNCLACGNSLFKNEDTICTSCLYHLPQTDFHLSKGNRLCEVFWGRVRIETAVANFYYGKSGKVQSLIHQLKYKGKKEVGTFFGKYYGKMLQYSGNFDSVNYIVPVPLHEKKLKLRGYNQSEIFARGLSVSMHVPVNIVVLSRRIPTQTQTKRNRYNRWENVSGIFEVNRIELLRNKHILLVDDVITTGATLEACCHALFKVPGIKISIAAIAYARK